MKRGYEGEIEGIKRRCIDSLQIKRKLKISPGLDTKRSRDEYHRGLYDGQNINEEGWYYYFLYSYNIRLKTEIEKAVSEIKKVYESQLDQLQNAKQGTLWVY